MATVQMPEGGTELLPSNSDKAKGATPTTTVVQTTESTGAKLVKGSAKGKIRKKSSFNELFFDTDLTAGEILEDLAKNTLIPRIKETVFDLVMGYLSIKLFGGKHAVNKNTFIRNGMAINSRINYAGMSSGVTNTNNIVSATSPRRTELNISAWEFDSKDDADLVFGVMCDTAVEYGSVSVAVFYQQLINLGLFDGDYDYTLQHWGWYKDTVMQAKVCPSRGGWFIDIAKAGSLR